MIVYDLQALQSDSFGDRGIGRYVDDLAVTLATEHPDAVDAFVWNDRRPVPARLDELRNHPVIGPRLRSWSQVAGRDVDVLHVTAPFDLLDWGEVRVPVRPRRTVVTCYDLIPYRFADVYLTDPGTRARYFTRLAMLPAADAVVTDSQGAADDVVALAGVPASRVSVVGGGTSDRFRPPEASPGETFAELRRHLPELDGRYVLVPTGIDWRKNIEGAIAAFGRLPSAVRTVERLVLVCKLDDGQRRWIEDLADNAGVGDRLVVTGYVDDDALVRLYQCADVVVVPSFLEGFGLPVLEARRCGARVICSGVPALFEVLPEESAWFDPHDVDDIADHLLRALVDDEYGVILDRVPDPGFTWPVAARRLVDVYDAQRASIDATRRASRTTPRALGVVTVLPPVTSGVADHSARLLDGFREIGIDVVAFVDSARAGTFDERDYPVLPLAALPTEWAAGRLDAVLVCIGNNRLHREAVTMLDVVPAHVLLHDVRLDQLLEPAARARIAATWYLDVDDTSVMWSAAVARRASSVLVQSAHAAQLVFDDSGVTAVDVGPHPCEQPADVAHDDDGGLPWVISAGIMHEVKGSDVVADAMARLVRDGVARAAIVGPEGHRFARPGVVVTGSVDDAEFAAWLRRASVAVQLRRSTNGESSGVVAHALARGVPLVVSDLGAMAELPDDVAVRLPIDADSDAVAEAVGSLLGDPDRRVAMRTAALAFAARETPAAQARRIAAAVLGP